MKWYLYAIGGIVALAALYYVFIHNKGPIASKSTTPPSGVAEVGTANQGIAPARSSSLIAKLGELRAKMMGDLAKQG